MKTCKACGNTYGNGVYCSQCGAKIEEDAENKTPDSGAPSIFLKYAAFLDNELLFKVALGKLSGVMAGNKKEAEEIFKVLAFRGHVESMYRYAEICLAQDPPDKETAYHWLRIAADAGHTPSRLLLASEKAPVPSQVPNQRMQIPKGNVGGGGENFEALVNDSLSAIVMILATKRQGRKQSVSAGSGFIVEGGYVVTNAHVVGDNPECVVGMFEPSIDQNRYSLMPLVIAPQYDVAILKFTGLAASRVEGRRQLSLRTQSIGFGERVYTVGNPLGIGLSVSQGIVSSPDRKSNYPSAVPSVIQTDITINHGNSGGALMDTENNVIGMVTFMPGNAEGGIGMCVPSAYIVKALNMVEA